MASSNVLYKAKDGTLVNLSTKVINNTTSDSTTDALSAAQGKVLNDKTFQTKDEVVDNTVDWNELTSPGCYKVQMATWGNAAYHGPNKTNENLYSYGLLYVLRADKNDTENRIHQIYFPRKIDDIVYMRMRNNGVWQTWHPIFAGITKADVGLSSVDNTADADKTVKAATTATKLGSATVGSVSKPIYLKNGTATECGSIMNAPQYSTTDLTPGVSNLADGQIYIVYFN